MSQHDTLTLEPCPFCGNEAHFVDDLIIVYASCPNCGATGAHSSYRSGAAEAWNRRAALSDTQPAQAAQSADERAMLEMIDERDRCHEWADQLASAIAEHTCHEIGEHTSANNPWRMALNALECHERQDTTHEAGARIKDLEAQAAQGETKRCEHCDDTGDVTSIDGHWRGYCTCQHGKAAQGEKPLFAAKIAARKWAELQEQGARMQSIAFDGHKSGQPGTIDPWGVVRWDQAAQGAGEVVYQYQNADGSWIDQQKSSYDYNVRYGAANVRVLYTQPAAGADVPDMVEIMALADSYRNATCQEATASAREWLRAAIAASGRQE